MTAERALVDLFHEALDAEDVAGPFQRLQLELEKSTDAVQRRRTRRIFMTRNRLALLAAALVVIVAAGVLVGTRIYSNHQGRTSVPAGTSAPVIDQVAVAQLLARPLQLHKLAANQACPPDGPLTQGLFGAGPVYGMGGSVDVSTTWGAYAKIYVITPPGLRGPIVVRSLNLNDGNPGIFLDPYGAGPVYGTDVVRGKSVKQYTAVALDLDHSPPATYDFGTTSYVQWYIEQGWPHNPGFCGGIQIDGHTFSEVFYAAAAPA